jgi:hypothetical protein
VRKGFGHREVPVKLEEGLGHLDFGDLTHGAGAMTDHGVDSVEPTLFVASDCVDSAPAVRECASVARHHQRGIVIGDQLERSEIAAERIFVETTLECDRGSDGGQEVIAGDSKLSAGDHRQMWPRE